MVLVDTSIWIDHVRSGDRALGALLDDDNVLMHPFVLGEFALGTPARRGAVLATLADIPRATMATDAEAMAFIERFALYGRGIGYVDAHLLGSTLLTVGARLWTRDRRLRDAADRLGVARL